MAVITAPTLSGLRVVYALIVTRPIGLTEREWEIAQRVGRGERTKTVADALQLSPRTVETHLANIYRKLGVRSRNDMVVLLNVSAPRQAADESVMVMAQTQYVRVGSASIAYQVFGAGPIDIVMVPGLASHLEMLWENLSWRRFVADVSALGRLIVFDKRGTGLSASGGRDQQLSPDQRIADGMAVLDDVGSERVIALGLSEGGPMALQAAVARPDRIAGVVIYGSAVLPGAETEERRRRLVSLAEASYGTGLVAGRLWPSLTGTDEGRFWLARYERHAATTSMLRRLMAMNMDMDVSGVVRRVRQPVAIVHNVNDPVVPFAEAERLVDALSHSKLFSTYGSDHMPWGAIDLKPLLASFRWTIAQAETSLTTS